MDFKTPVNNLIDEQTLNETTKFPPSTGVKNIMVSGGNGFIGSWVIRALAITYSERYQIVSFDKLDYGASLNNTKMLEGRPNFSFFQGDITSPDDIARCLRKHDIDTIIHLAANSSVDASFTSPFAFASTNIHGTQVLLESAKSCGVKRFIHMSSYEAYGATKAGPSGHVETSALSPVNPYGAGKAAAEMLVTAFGNTHELETIIVRSNNVYGPNQFPEKIIPKFIMMLKRGLKLPLYGAGNQTRRYLYAGDAANAFNVLLHRGIGGEIYNLGSPDELTNKALCSTLLTLIQPPGPTDVNAWIQSAPDRPFHDRGSGLDCSKLRSLGWEQTVSMEEGLRRTAAWYSAYGETWWGDVGKVFAKGVPMSDPNPSGVATNGTTANSVETNGGS